MDPGAGARRPAAEAARAQLGAAAAVSAVLVSSIIVTPLAFDSGEETRAGGSSATSPAAERNVPEQGGDTADARFVRFGGTDYEADVPKGWKMSADEPGRLRFLDASQGSPRSLSFRRGGSADDDYAGTLTRLAEDLANDEEEYPGFEQEGAIRDIAYQGFEAAEIQYTYDYDGVPSRVRIRLFHFGDSNASVLLHAPVALWDESVPYYERFLQTLRELS
ncbi:hypothetical protein BJF79_35815 [Actinomadura sp. CNU-125]|uniref:hypothetical protein n=1 Tax=Actinomadura sp. CNU-125 TaxID=1904961 RepID=UPI00095C2845|nr:hypothetical protein [Actinomadura sp. CNU-125]OLT32630.1 hypothetical protein BJF79_35815 [Actinomadura sp. CNU-125]